MAPSRPPGKAPRDRQAVKGTFTPKGPSRTLIARTGIPRTPTFAILSSDDAAHNVAVASDSAVPLRGYMRKKKKQRQESGLQSGWVRHSICDAAADYILFCRHVNYAERTIQWDEVSPADRAVKSDLHLDFQAGSPGSILYFYILAEYQLYVERYLGGPENSNRPDVEYVWNWHTWHRFIIKSVQHTKFQDLPPGTSFNPAEFCWYSTYSLQGTSSHYPKVSIEGGSYWKMDLEKCSAGRRPNQYTFFTDPAASTFKKTVAKLFSVLRHGTSSLEGAVADQTSHRCYDEPNTCWNFAHVLHEDDFSNKDRGHCIHGTAQLCPHQPKCLFVDRVTGIPIKHRNMAVFAPCDCFQDCYDPERTQRRRSG